MSLGCTISLSDLTSSFSHIQLLLFYHVALNLDIIEYITMGLIDVVLDWILSL